MPRPFLILQLRPEDDVADDELRALMHHGGLNPDQVVRARVERTGLPEIELDDYAGIIVGGSPFDISTPEPAKSAAQVRVEAGFMELLDRVIGRDFPFLGACSGSGLLGKFCGVSISTRYAEPVGGVDVTLTEAGRHDPLLEGAPPTFRVLLGHKEACDETPRGAVLLASSETCPVQMFRLGRNVYATQFHPEADAQGFEVRIRAYRNHGYFAPDEARRLIADVAGEHTPHARRILERFVQRFSD